MPALTTHGGGRDVRVDRGFKRVPCPDCGGSGELRIESENITEDFEVEKQTVIAECPACRGLGFQPPAGPL